MPWAPPLLAQKSRARSNFADPVRLRSVRLPSSSRRRRFFGSLRLYVVDFGPGIAACAVTALLIAYGCSTQRQAKAATRTTKAELKQPETALPPSIFSNDMRVPEMHRLRRAVRITSSADTRLAELAKKDEQSAEPPREPWVIDQLQREAEQKRQAELAEAERKRIEAEQAAERKRQAAVKEAKRQRDLAQKQAAHMRALEEEHVRALRVAEVEAERKRKLAAAEAERVRKAALAQATKRPPPAQPKQSTKAPSPQRSAPTKALAQPAPAKPAVKKDVAKPRPEVAKVVAAPRPKVAPPPPRPKVAPPPPRPKVAPPPPRPKVAPPPKVALPPPPPKKREPIVVAETTIEAAPPKPAVPPPPKVAPPSPSKPVKKVERPKAPPVAKKAPPPPKVVAKPKPRAPRPAKRVDRKRRPTPMSAQEATKTLALAFERVTGEEATKEAVSVLWAQWALETGRGRWMVDYNYAGLKGRAPDGGSAPWSTWEETDDGPRRVRSRFRAYESADHGAYDYVKLLSRRYPRAFASARIGDAQTFIARLDKGGFFTERPEHYVRSVMSLAREFLRKHAKLLLAAEPVEE